jgi:hypothetical protein
VGDLEILVPVAVPRVREQPLAPRLDGLSGRRVAMLANRKANAGLLLDGVADQLGRLAGPLAVVREEKAATVAAPGAVMGRLQRCDAVVLAIAD